MNAHVHDLLLIFEKSVCIRLDELVHVLTVSDFVVIQERVECRKIGSVLSHVGGEDETDRPLAKDLELLL